MCLIEIFEKELNKLIGKEVYIVNYGRYLQCLSYVMGADQRMFSIAIYFSDNIDEIYDYYSTDDIHIYDMADPEFDLELLACDILSCVFYFRSLVNEPLNKASDKRWIALGCI